VSQYSDVLALEAGIQVRQDQHKKDKKNNDRLKLYTFMFDNGELDIGEFLARVSHCAPAEDLFREWGPDGLPDDDLPQAPPLNAQLVVPMVPNPLDDLFNQQVARALNARDRQRGQMAVVQAGAPQAGGPQAGAVQVGMAQVAAQGGGAAAQGHGAAARGRGALARGRGAVAQGRGAAARGRGAPAQGHGAAARGRGALARGRGAVAQGRGAAARGRGAAARGRGAAARGRGAVAQGRGAAARGRGAAARGRGALAQGRGGGHLGGGIPDPEEESLCIICMVNQPVYCVVLCGHTVVCDDCKPGWDENEPEVCPLCRSAVVCIIKPLFT